MQGKNPSGWSWRGSTSLAWNDALAVINNLLTSYVNQILVKTSRKIVRKLNNKPKLDENKSRECKDHAIMIFLEFYMKLMNKMFEIIYRSLYFSIFLHIPRPQPGFGLEGSTFGFQGVGASPLSRWLGMIFLDMLTFFIWFKESLFIHRWESTFLMHAWKILYVY